MSLAIKTAVVLNSPNDWDEWIEVIKTRGIGGEIWQYTDPAATGLPLLEEPRLPTPKDVDSAKSKISELDEDEKEELRVLRLSYKRKLALYDRQKVALANMRSFIQETVSRTYLVYTFDCDTPHDMLKALKKRAAPTDRARKIELIQQYQKLKEAPQAVNIEAWLQQWEKTYKECKELKLPDVDDDRPLYDFLQAVHSLAPEFSSIWTITIQAKLDASEELPDLYKIVELFRNNWRLVSAQRRRGSHSAYAASFQKQSEEKTDEKRLCLCGEPHNFPQCAYLIKSMREDGWKPDPTIQRRINDKLKIPALKRAVERARQAAGEPADEEAEEPQGEDDVEEPTAF